MRGDHGPFLTGTSAFVPPTVCRRGKSGIKGRALSPLTSWPLCRGLAWLHQALQCEAVARGLDGAAGPRSWSRPASAPWARSRRTVTSVLGPRFTTGKVPALQGPGRRGPVAVTRGLGLQWGGQPAVPCPGTRPPQTGAEQGFVSPLQRGGPEARDWIPPPTVTRCWAGTAAAPEGPAGGTRQGRWLGWAASWGPWRTGGLGIRISQPGLQSTRAHTGWLRGAHGQACWEAARYGHGARGLWGLPGAVPVTAARSRSGSLWDRGPRPARNSEDRAPQSSLAPAGFEKRASVALGFGEAPGPLAEWEAQRRQVEPAGTESAGRPRPQARVFFTSRPQPRLH